MEKNDAKRKLKIEKDDCTELLKLKLEKGDYLLS